MKKIIKYLFFIFITISITFLIYSKFLNNEKKEIIEKNSNFEKINKINLINSKKNNGNINLSGTIEKTENPTINLDDFIIVKISENNYQFKKEKINNYLKESKQQNVFLDIDIVEKNKLLFLNDNKKTFFNKYSNYFFPNKEKIDSEIIDKSIETSKSIISNLKEQTFLNKNNFLENGNLLIADILFLKGIENVEKKELLGQFKAYKSFLIENPKKIKIKSKLGKINDFYLVNDKYIFSKNLLINKEYINFYIKNGYKLKFYGIEINNRIYISNIFFDNNSNEIIHDVKVYFKLNLFQELLTSLKEDASYFILENNIIDKMNIIQNYNNSLYILFQKNKINLNNYDLFLENDTDFLKQFKNEKEKILFFAHYYKDFLN